MCTFFFEFLSYKRNNSVAIVLEIVVETAVGLLKTCYNIFADFPTREVEVQKVMNEK